MSVRISISSQLCVRRTTTRLRSISGCSACCTSSWMRCRFSCAASRVVSEPCVICGGSDCEGSATARRGRSEGGVVEVERLAGTGAGAVALLVCTGWICLLLPLKASMIDSDITRYLPSLTTETAYITTKNASSSVIRSA